ncbi:DUF222 domain-containing protein, partial [Nocardia pseudobrasiliensis]|uniref:DUF222 domain-containing protein n=1 Tax=Nocardia pseudobrasiliensis TaxID=45979 RepID=UPI0012E9105C
MFSIPESIADPSAEAAVSLLEAAAEQVSKLNTIPLSNRDRLTMLRRLEAVTRALPAVGLELVAQLHEQWDTGEFASSSMIDVLADSLRITPAEARARWRAADDLAHHTSLTGEVLDPVLPAIATAQADGVIGAAHVKIVRDTLAHLPCVVDAETKAHAEAELAHYATQLRPDQLRKVADKLEALINPDGVFTDVDRARRRSFTLGRQGPDLMSRCTLIADPELRAYLETVLAKYAKPGICNPDDDKPCVEDEPDPDTSQRDTRSAPQRQHDGLKTVLRDSIASGRLGQHRGLPVTRIVSMTLRELETALGTTQSTHPASSAPLDRGCPARPKYAAKMVAAMDVASSAEASVSRGAVGAAYSAEPVGAVNVAYPVDVASSAEASVSRGAVGAAYSAEP